MARNALCSGRNEVARFATRFVLAGPDWKRIRFGLLPPPSSPDSIPTLYPPDPIQIGAERVRARLARAAAHDARATATARGARALRRLLAEGKEKQNHLEVFNFTGAGGVALSMYNTDESIRAFATASMTTAYEKKWLLYLSTKNTILKKYDGRFKDIFQDVYKADWKSKFEGAGIW